KARGMNDTLPIGFAPADGDALPLHTVRRETLGAWRDAQPAGVGAWIDAHAFDATPGTLLPLPGDDCGIAGALVAVGDPLDPFGWSHAPAGLPGGRWRIASQATPQEARALQLCWGLGAYRFDRYKHRPCCPALLAGDHDGATFDILAACVRVRDLVNTPSQDMGPEQPE